MAISIQEIKEQIQLRRDEIAELRQLLRIVCKEQRLKAFASKRQPVEEIKRRALAKG